MNSCLFFHPFHTFHGCYSQTKTLIQYLVCRFFETMCCFPRRGQLLAFPGNSGLGWEARFWGVVEIFISFFSFFILCTQRYLALRSMVLGGGCGQSCGISFGLRDLHGKRSRVSYGLRGLRGICVPSPQKYVNLFFLEKFLYFYVKFFAPKILHLLCLSPALPLWLCVRMLAKSYAWRITGGTPFPFTSYGSGYVNSPALWTLSFSGDR